MKLSVFTFIVCGLVSTIFYSCSKEKRSEEAAEKMQAFVADISGYARQMDSDFLIIPQNGIELAWQSADPEGEPATEYMNAIDGFGVEELFYNGQAETDTYRLDMLRQLVDEKPVLVSEFIEDPTEINEAVAMNHNEGFLCFPRDVSNYDYLEIPDSVYFENDDDILELSDAKNYLYLISNEAYATKSAFIDAVKATNFDLVIMDLFFGDETFTSADIAQLKTKANGGKRLVISYVNVGSAEKFRYYWKNCWGLHHPLWLRRRYEGYDDEFWVKFWKKEWQDIIFGNDDSYMKKVIDAGFDGAYLDNVEAYYFLYYKD
ncbi:MAG: endo alpha-1,4 polygalactosaminidase [Flavobacteriales bacterium]|nr:endo alpha-1,4 polygalactosaminidase [Flavobacteriales bacterium]